MKRNTRIFLLSGCALILALEGPLTLAALAAGWRGPYERREEDARAALVPLPSSGVPALELARR